MSQTWTLFLSPCWDESFSPPPPDSDLFSSNFAVWKAELECRIKCLAARGPRTSCRAMCNCLLACYLKPVFQKRTFTETGLHSAHVLRVFVGQVTLLTLSGKELVSFSSFMLLCFFKPMYTKCTHMFIYAWKYINPRKRCTLWQIKSLYESVYFEL